ncbi:MAG: glucoamylase family protein [Bacteroidota bacterium]
MSKLVNTVLIILAVLVSCGSPRNNTAGSQAGKQKAALSDEQLLDTIQYLTFQYFWDGAEPVSGCARERIHMDNVYPEGDQDVITSGGTGFGLMNIIVGIDRGFITREEGIARFEQIVDFLGRSDRFHGAWPHWLYGPTGKVKPFSPNDDGGDIVETAYLVQGLLTVKQFLNPADERENTLAGNISELVNGVEWDWYQRGENALTWHWSPRVGWKINFRIGGYNECLIAYILGASSPTHPLTREAYDEGWARNGEISGITEKYGYQLNLLQRGVKIYDGPLFWAHYSFLGLDPRHLKDQYGDYWAHNVAQTLIDRAHCIANPNGYIGYGANCWGLTASYSTGEYHGPAEDSAAGILIPVGYAAHSPERDYGVISPTAALSSMPYAPEAALEAARHFYFDLGDKILGPYGFYDAFNETYNWYPKRYLAIDQGPVTVMIENYRTGRLWDLFMKNTEVTDGLDRLGFTYK